ncbi:MAG: ribosome-associated translation inhibitor RaiA [Candidatus Saccharimonadales bacterium]
MLKLTIEGVHINLDGDLEKYANKKIGGLEKYVPKRARESAHAEVILKRVPSKDKNKFCCEITLHLPHEILNCKETTQHLYAAIDVASAKARHQLQKYKDEHGTPRLYRRLFDRRSRQTQE